MLCVNMVVYRANKKLQDYHSKEPSKNCCFGYVISENNEVNMPKKMERKFFFGYSVYAWCLPLVLVVVSMVFDLMPIIPSSYLKPNFGDNKCWFSSKWHDFVVINKSIWRRSWTKEIMYDMYVQSIFYHGTRHWRAGNGNITNSAVSSLVIKILPLLKS